MNMSIDNRYCNRFIHIGRPIFCELQRCLCLQSRWHLGTRVRGVTLARHRSSNLRPGQVGSSLLDSSMLWLFCEAMPSPIIVFTSIPTCFAGTNSIAIDLITVKDRFCFSASATSPGPPATILDCFTLLLARHIADVSCYIGPCMPSGICMEIHTEIVEKRKKKQSHDEGNPRQPHVYL